MGKLTEIISIDPGRTGEVLNILDDCYEEVEQGRVVGITVILELKDRTYSIAGSSVRSRYETAGMLLEAANKRLQLPHPNDED